jgi:hypothetical protein
MSARLACGLFGLFLLFGGVASAIPHGLVSHDGGDLSAAAHGPEFLSVPSDPQFFGTLKPSLEQAARARAWYSRPVSPRPVLRRGQDSLPAKPRGPLFRRKRPLPRLTADASDPSH